MRRWLALMAVVAFAGCGESAHERNQKALHRDVQAQEALRRQLYKTAEAEQRAKTAP